ncbi:MAG: hypothetical protein AUJ57_09955 [Zetaproteobacteria bacterium CG1_02_53_45]|nr:MAG: hypothetical protein AUJ57_09955 [Zetaproteobacteria bacterium CG1_02_53_45]
MIITTQAPLLVVGAMKTASQSPRAMMTINQSQKVTKTILMEHTANCPMMKIQSMGTLQVVAPRSLFATMGQRCR